MTVDVETYDNTHRMSKSGMAELKPYKCRGLILERTWLKGRHTKSGEIPLAWCDGKGTFGAGV